MYGSDVFRGIENDGISVARAHRRLRARVFARVRVPRVDCKTIPEIFYFVHTLISLTKTDLWLEATKTRRQTAVSYTCT